MVVMMAFLERKDMPHSIMGIPGLNLWNVLMINTVWAWCTLRKQQGLVWDFPGSVKKGFYAFVFVIVWAFSRYMIDPTSYSEQGRAEILVNYFIDPLKFLLPGWILFDGCRDRRQMQTALGCILSLYFILACLTIKNMGLSNIGGSDLSGRAVKAIQRATGYHRVDMSMMLAGASWGMVVFAVLMRSFFSRLCCCGLGGIILLGQALTGGRMGYLTWGAVGLVLALLRWRKLLVLMPLAIVALVLFVPGVRDRMLQGFGSSAEGRETASDSSEITSGRVNAWPRVIEKIKESPAIGYGRLAMMRTGVAAGLLADMNEVFAHPHNAYLEMLLDNGIIGFLLVMPLYFWLVHKCCILFRDRSDPLVQASGGVALCLLLGLMLAAFGAQTFYPREGAVGMWAAVGLALRAWMERTENPDDEFIFESTGNAEGKSALFPEDLQTA
jgi:O-antigen ligase